MKSILKKDLHKVLKHLQNMIMRIMDYIVKIVYKPGNKLYVTDTLSRTYMHVNNFNVNPSFEYAYI